MDGPDTCNTNHCLLEVIIGIYTLCGVQHGLHNGEREKKKLASCPEPDPPRKKKNNKGGDTGLAEPHLTCALCLRLGDSSAVPVHDRFLGASITTDFFDGAGRRERPPGREGELGAETMLRS